MNLTKKINFHTLTLATLVATGIFTGADANERKFSYTYETATLPAGEAELEAWNTFRAGRNTYYNALDQRLELEWGITNSLQAALYLNNRVSQGVAPDGSLADPKSELKGMNFELKHQLSNPDADAIGSAYYLELGVQAHELELEGKLLLDKRFGPLTTAFNLVYESELEFERKLENGDKAKADVELEEEKSKLKLLGAISYPITPRTGIGLEILNSNVTDNESEKTYSAWFAGPSVSFGGANWWGVFTVLPQLGSEGTAHEKFETRLLLGFHL